MKNIINKLIFSSLTVAFTSCIANYDNINSNPYQPGDLNADDYALGSAMNNLAGCVISPDVNTAQFTDCLQGGPLGGYYTTSNAGFEETFTNFNANDAWCNVFLKAEKIIPVLYSNLSSVEIVSQNTNDPVPYAIAQIIKVAAMHRVADAYGPIPYSKIGKNGALTTPYDSEKVAYDTFFDELTASISVLNENLNALLTPTADYVYSGNIRKWIKFANSLKLRLAIRLVYVNQEKARAMAEEAVKAENGGVIESNEDNAAWNYFTTIQNPVYVATRYNQVQSNKHDDNKDCVTGGDTHTAADIVCYMNGYKDNRREKYFTKSEWVGCEYVGMRRGIIIPDLTSKGHKYSGVNILPFSPLYWMNAAEVAFLRAEGTAIFNFNMGGSAESFYNKGIRLSFEQWGADGAEAYMNNEVNNPETYIDPSGDNTFAEKLSTITIKWVENATKEEKQERIIIQKWVANWQLGNEAWADYRRTGYPHLIPATEAGNKSGGVVNSVKGVRRLPYPLDEYINNTDNVEEAVSNYLKGSDNMATDLWWAGKKSN